MPHARVKPPSRQTARAAEAPPHPSPPKEGRNTGSAELGARPRDGGPPPKTQKQRALCLLACLLVCLFACLLRERGDEADAAHTRLTARDGSARGGVERGEEKAKAALRKHVRARRFIKECDAGGGEGSGEGGLFPEGGDFQPARPAGCRQETLPALCGVQRKSWGEMMGQYDHHL